MPISRRRLLAAAAAAPVVLVAERGLRWAGEGARAVTAGLRPPANGTSATRCALCGDPGHTMLAPSCPAARRVL